MRRLHFQGRSKAIIIQQVCLCFGFVLVEVGQLQILSIPHIISRCQGYSRTCNKSYTVPSGLYYYYYTVGEGSS